MSDAYVCSALPGVCREKNHLRRFHWRYIIIDEAHRIKNENSALSKVSAVSTCEVV